MNQKRIVTEPVSLIRASARKAMRGRMGILIASAVIYTLCVSVPIIVVEQITGVWDVMERATEEYVTILQNSLINEISYEVFNEELTEWAQAYSPNLGASPASFLFMLLVPGSLTLGLSVIQLRVLRGKEAYTDMVFSGFSNFMRATLLHLTRTIFMFLWMLILVIPGFIAYYRYSLAFFLLADNPTMSPLTALTLSKYYMQGNKGSRFVLDLSFIGWLALSYFVYLGFSSIAATLGADSSFFIQMMVSAVLSAIIFAPLIAYHGVTTAEYYHRVICRDPRSFTDPPALPHN